MVDRERKPNVFIVAGPNGAGKSTFARLFLPDYADCKEFVNADLIAAGLSPFNPESLAIEAGRLMLDRIETLAAPASTSASRRLWRGGAMCPG